MNISKQEHFHLINMRLMCLDIVVEHRLAFYTKIMAKVLAEINMKILTLKWKVTQRKIARLLLNPRNIVQNAQKCFRSVLSAKIKGRP